MCISSEWVEECVSSLKCVGELGDREGGAEELVQEELQSPWTQLEWLLGRQQDLVCVCVCVCVCVYVCVHHYGNMQFMCCTPSV